MTKLQPQTLQQLAARLEEQAIEMAALRSALAIQFTRIAQMQAQLDVMPAARTKRDVRSTHLLPVPAHSGNGNSHR